VLGQQDGVGEADVAGSGDGDLHGFIQFDQWCIQSLMWKVSS
jgi:hypothetical protein